MLVIKQENPTTKQTLIFKEPPSFSEQLDRLENFYFQSVRSAPDYAVVYELSTRETPRTFLPDESGVGYLDWSYQIGSICPGAVVHLEHNVSVLLISQSNSLLKGTPMMIFQVDGSNYEITDHDTKWQSFMMNGMTYRIIGTGYRLIENCLYLCYRLTTDFKL